MVIVPSMSLTTTGLSQSHKNTRARHVATPEYDDVTLNVRVFTPFCSPSCLSWSDDRRSVLTYVSGRAAGAGSGALTMSLLRAVGPEGHVYSYEIRDDHLAFARDNVADYFGGEPEWWTPRLGDFGEVTADDLDGQVDRVILDMVEPWHFIDTVKNVLIPGGVFMTYVATVPQLMNIMEAIREAKCFTEPRAWETLLREWKVEGLATRPEHRMNAHTAFLVWTRRLADGVTPPRPQRRARR